jgi:NAD(P)-dependent dehydrogenase (short-subunit alcohol dehydrogenase family)
MARQATTLEELELQVPGTRGYLCDVGVETDVQRAFTQVRNDLGDVDVLVFNAGPGAFKGIEETTAADFENTWRVNAFGALLCSQQVMPSMKDAGAGTIIFMGATASRIGSASTAAFAPAKAAQRSLAESMAKSLWPAGVHVCLIVVDGMIDTPRVREMFPAKPDSFFVKAIGVAEAAWQLTRQDDSALSFEVDVRPLGELL